MQDVQPGREKRESPAYCCGRSVIPRRIRRSCVSGILGRGYDKNWPNSPRVEVRWQEQEETTCSWNGIAVLRRILLVVLGNRKAHVHGSGVAGTLRQNGRRAFKA